jgi:ribA/ribD-fused uncharacterized protein
MSSDLHVKIGDELDPRWKLIARHNEKEIFGFFGEYRFLSNFWPAYVFYEEKVYPTAENAYQAAKYYEHQRHSLVSCPPEEAKRFSRKHLASQRYPKWVWNEKKVSIMRDLLYSKFIANPDLRDKLLATGDRQLVEANWWEDSFWGVYVPKEGIPFGSNVLGKLLMEVRAEVLD